MSEAPRALPARIRLAHWQVAVFVLDKVWGGRQAADAALQAWFRDHRQMGGRDRANVTGLVYGALRDAMRLQRHRWRIRVRRSDPCAARTLG